MADRSSRTYYEILHIVCTASSEEIKKTYRELARLHHPDAFAEAMRAAEASGNPIRIRLLKEKIREEEEELKLINQAYDVLSDPEKRSRYDERLGLLYGMINKAALGNGIITRPDWHEGDPVVYWFVPNDVGKILPIVGEENGYYKIDQGYVWKTYLTV